MEATAVSHVRAVRLVNVVQSMGIADKTMGTVARPVILSLENAQTH